MTHINPKLGRAVARTRQTSEETPRISVIDLIRVTCEVVNPKKTWMDFKDAHKSLVEKYCTVYRFPGRGSKDTPMVGQDDIMILLEPLLARSRIPIERKLEMLGRAAIPLVRYTEIEIHAQVCQALAHFRGVQQYQVKQYRVDLYYPKERVAVECDEHGHNAYDAKAEIDRHNTISDTLKCSWVRYNPYATDFDIFHLIHKIGVQLLSSLKAGLHKGILNQEARMVPECEEIRLAELALRKAEVELATTTKNVDGEVQIEIERTKQAVEKTKQLELETKRLELTTPLGVSDGDALGTPIEASRQAEGTTERQLENQILEPPSPPPIEREVVQRPARRREPTVPTDVQDYPFQPFIDRYLEPETDVTKGLQWSALKVPFKEWHTREFPNERLNNSLPKTILDYFSSKLGGWHDTSRGGVKVKGFFGWRLREHPLSPSSSENEPAEDDEPAEVAEVVDAAPNENDTSEPPAQEPKSEDLIVQDVNHISTIPPGGSAVERAELDIVRILNEITGTNRELGWDTILARRNPAINDRAMTRGRKRLLDSGRVFKRAVLGNSCVYSLIR